MFEIMMYDNNITIEMRRHEPFSGTFHLRKTLFCYGHLHRINRKIHASGQIHDMIFTCERDTHRERGHCFTHGRKTNNEIYDTMYSFWDGTASQKPTSYTRMS